MRSKSIIALLLFLLFSPPLLAGTKVLDYGFEDWIPSGTDEATGNTTPGASYIFSMSSTEYWTTHKVGTHVVGSCGSLTPYAGNKFWILNWYTGAADACLGSTPDSINAHNNIGNNSTYPTGRTGNAAVIEDSVTSNTIVVRFYFACLGNWSSTQNSSIDTGSGLKFIRIYGAGSSDGCLLKTLNDGDDTNPRIGFWHEPDDVYWTSPGINWQDGAWHSMCYKVVRNNDTNTGNNITASYWLDDWDMSGDATASYSYNLSDMGAYWRYAVLLTNWSALSPTSSMGMALDDIEVWDGLPDEEASSTTSTGMSATGMVWQQ